MCHLRWARGGRTTEVRDPMILRHYPPRQRRRKDSFLPPTRWLFPPRMVLGLIGAVSLVLSGCAFGDANQGYMVVSVTYEYTDQNRSAIEWHAFLTAQDQCYFAGYEYAQAEGPPQIVSDGGMTNEPFRSTRSFYCIGLRADI
jgi:hypothetical protein